jgi:peptide/nickel transport system ATP-binding protein
MPILQVNHLQLSFRTDAGTVSAIQDISFSLERGQTLGIVGESGSGKSSTALAIMGLLPPTATVQGEILFALEGKTVDLLQLQPHILRRLRGDRLGMIFQEPMASLNPLFTCGTQIAETLLQHQQISKKEAIARAIQLCHEVNLPEPEKIIHRYPHQLSGGQIQRIMIAMAIACNPDILIADEPTTALDVTVQATILELLKRIQQERGMALIFISHDLGVISQIADQVLIMYQGKIVEYGSVRQVFHQPQHPYTKGLIACRPQPELNLLYLPTVSDFMAEENGTLISKNPPLFATKPPKEPTPPCEPLLRVQDLTVAFPVRNILGMVKEYKIAVDRLSFEVFPGETLGLVGESGCGKTTTGRAILRLLPLQGGKVFFDGVEITALKPKELTKLRCHMQIVFQDPYGSLNPRMTIGQILLEPLLLHRQELYPTKQDRLARVKYLLERVGIDPQSMGRFPHEFSGGQRQRIGIARALALNPKLIIADEAVSSLDVSVQAQVLNLLKELQQEFELTYIFISHDLSVVKHMSDRIMVMQNGKIVELDTADRIYYQPQNPYTQQLISAIPKMHSRESCQQ